MNGLSPNPGNGGIGPEPKPDSGPATLNIKVAHGLNQHDVAVPANSTFGDLKSVIVQKIGLKPETHKLLFRGKEKEHDEFLQTAGVKDNCKVLLMEDTTCRQKSPEQVKETSVISRGVAAVAEVREEVDKLADQVAALQAVLDSGTQVDNKNIIYLTEMLMRQLLKLDGIEAEGEGRVQRKMEVRRVQSFVETMDIFKSRNSILFANANNTASVTTQWETFETGSGSMSTVSAAPSSVSTAPAPAPNPTPTPAHGPAPAPTRSSTPTALPVPSSTATSSPMPSSMPTALPVPSPTATLSPTRSSPRTPVPSSTVTPSPMPPSTPTTFPVPSSTAMPSHMSSSTPATVPSSTPTLTGVPSSTPTPMPVPSSISTPMPFPAPLSNPFSSSASSPMPSATKVTQEWEHFD